MKLLLQVLFFLFLSTSVFAQVPILTSSNSNPQVGDRFLLYAPNLPDTFIAGPAGPNAIWDFSIMVIDTADTLTIALEAPSTLPNSNLYPSANIGYEFGFFEYYYLVNADSFTFIGGGVFEDNFSENPRRILTYPFTYGDTLIDQFSGPVPSAGNDSVRYGSTLVHADAYGTLVLPYGSLTNILRVKTEATFIDSSDMGVFRRHTEIRYQWFKPGIHYPILNYHFIETDGTTITFYSLIDQSIALNLDLLAEDLVLSIFPNPTSDLLNITYSLHEIGETSISLFDIIGRELIKKESKGIPGLVKESLEISHLEAGTYFLSLTTGNRQLTRKVIIQ